MRIYGPNGTAIATASGAPRRTASGKFSLNEPETSRSTSGAGSLRSVGSVDALIALQGVEDPTERRRRAVGRGRQALDVLDDLKLGMIGGDLAPSLLGRLKSAAEGLKSLSGDAGLDGVLAEIDLRVAVELAKAGVR